MAIHVSEKLPLYFWRDKTGNEIDLIVENGMQILPVEIKSSKTYNASMKSNISAWLTLKENTSEKGIVIFRGDTVVRKNSAITVTP